VTPEPDSIQTSNGEPSAAAGGTSVPPSTAAGGTSVPERAAAIAQERPEVAVGAAFGGGLLLALILKRLAR
jgi:hypothetical protein